MNQNNYKYDLEKIQINLNNAEQATHVGCIPQDLTFKEYKNYFFDVMVALAEAKFLEFCLENNVQLEEILGKKEENEDEY